MINKFHSNLLTKVKTLSFSNYDCIVYSTNFEQTKKEFDNLKIDYTPYPVANCFYVNANYNNLKKVSEISSVKMLSSTTKVSALIHNSKKFLNIEKIIENKYYGQDITIAFIDTGISPHLDFLLPQNRVLEFIDLINNKKTMYDDNGHGTFVASVCCGSGKSNGNLYAGIAPMSNIVMIKALNEKGETDSRKILDAMQYIYDNARRLNIKIVCMSFGADSIGENDPLQKGAMSLWQKGIVVVAAAGNSGPKNKTIKSPGANSKIITVGGLDSINETGLIRVADFSSRGPTTTRFKPDLLAPSVNIFGANFKLKPSYTQMSGTSVSAPIVAGVCAILVQKYPSISPDRLKYMLIKNCKSIMHDKNSEGFGYIQF